MYPVYYSGLIRCECSQTIGNHMFWWHVSCLLLWPDLVWMQPNHGMHMDWWHVSCLSLWPYFGVNSGNPYQFIWFGDMYPVYYCGLDWCECSQPIGIHMVRWHVSCLLLGPYLVRMLPNHKKSYGLVTYILFIFVALFCVNAAKAQEFICPVTCILFYYCGLILCECNQNIGIRMVWWNIIFPMDF